MTEPMHHEPDPRFDLFFDRTVDVPKELVWRAWTEPELLMQWFCPLPWRTTACEIDLRPGGAFRTVMEGPDGEKMDSTGCFLEVVPMQKLAWTSSLGPGYRPLLLPDSEACDAFHFSAVITMEDSPTGAKYRALAIHGDESTRQKHDEMGFQDGWGAAYEQMVAMLRTM